MHVSWAIQVAINFLKTGPYLLHTTDFLDVNSVKWIDDHDNFVVN